MTNNSGSISRSNEEGYVGSNSGTILHNAGGVYMNEESGTIDVNYGRVSVNKGKINYDYRGGYVSPVIEDPDPVVPVIPATPVVTQTVQYTQSEEPEYIDYYGEIYRAKSYSVINYSYQGINCLPLSVIRFIQENHITVNFYFNYNGYKYLVPVDDREVEEFEWYGPLKLAELYW